MTVKAMILDLDGVITDTAEYHYRAWKHLAEDEGVPFDRSANEALRGVSRRASLVLLMREHIHRYTEDQIQEMMARKNAYYVGMLEDITPGDFLPGAWQLLQEIKSHGLKVAIGSASRNSMTVLTRLGIADFFDGISDGYCVVRAKPAPDVFVYAAGLVGVPVSECAVIEDASAGIEGALEAGMVAVAVGPAERFITSHFRYDSTETVNLQEILGIQR